MEKGLIEFVRNSFISGRFMEYEPKNSVCICYMFTISKKKRIYFSIYRPAKATNINLFFEEMTSEQMNKYENFIIM